MREIIFILLLIVLGTLPFMLSRPDLEADTIHVTPGINSDKAIANKVVARLAQHPVLAKRSIQVSSRNGVVTLTGAVANEVESRDALVSVREVPGVKKINLNLTIEDSLNTYWEDASRKAEQIVEDSRNEVEKVRKAAGEVLQESVAETADAAITAAVKFKLLEDLDLNSSGIHVNTSRGVVRLGGTVPDAEQLERAVNLARSVKYVARVDSQLVIVNPDTGS